MANKERELQQALQKQEKYQQAVQELTAKMERAQISLARTPASVAADIDTQMKDYKVSVSAEKKWQTRSSWRSEYERDDSVVNCLAILSPRLG